jgi:hypothetical protein
LKRRKIPREARKEERKAVVSQSGFPTREAIEVLEGERKAMSGAYLDGQPAQATTVGKTS